MKLIVDSGSTKTSWGVILPGGASFVVHTTGINPVRDDEAAMQAVVEKARAAIEAELIRGQVASLLPVSSQSPAASLREVLFFGAGCIPPYSEALRRVLCGAFGTAKVNVDSDLMGAAQSLLGRSEGIVCILGTGSNSCLYDGQRIVRQVSPLGWILGDEASGAVLGRTLVSDLLKGQLPSHLRAAFEARFHLTQADIIDAVYRRPQPNRFLASLVPFLSEQRADASVRALLLREFRRFLVRNVAAYERRDLSLNFVGGVAYEFENELREAVELEGFMMGRVSREVIGNLMHYHLS